MQSRTLDGLRRDSFQQTMQTFAKSRHTARPYGVGMDGTDTGVTRPYAPA